MFLSVFRFYYVLHFLLNYCNVFGDEDPFHRFIVEEGFKPAIFGSYYYDPIKDEFDIPKRHHNVPQIVNSSFVLSTAIGSGETTLDSQDQNSTKSMYRANHATTRPTQWWARKLSKTTMKLSRFQRLN